MPKALLPTLRLADTIKNMTRILANSAEMETTKTKHKKAQNALAIYAKLKATHKQSIMLTTMAPCRETNPGDYFEDAFIKSTNL